MRRTVGGRVVGGLLVLVALLLVVARLDRVAVEPATGELAFANSSSHRSIVDPPSSRVACRRVQSW